MTNFTGFYALFYADKFDISNRTQNNCLSQDTNYFYINLPLNYNNYNNNVSFPKLSLGVREV